MPQATKPQLALASERRSVSDMTAAQRPTAATRLAFRQKSFGPEAVTLFSEMSPLVCKSVAS